MTKKWDKPQDIDPDEVEDWRELNAPEKNYFARKLERRAVEAELEDEEERSDHLIDTAKEVYWHLVEEEFVGSFPYQRLAILYRKEEDYDDEVRILERCLRQAKLGTEKKEKKFENRLDRARELRAQS
ncbi:hypothetical protein [Salinibacter grassmerensis]|uniref:hypothetical protein n=1 Tax=Salinibacter grassmerensis TaxID=3040353 RepID=UPI0021E7EFD0|nr:hypothetical protein [Salinibacter grassmerensis]